MALSVKNFGGGGSIGAVENLFVPTLGTTELYGVTCTNNGDGSYTLTGTVTGTKSASFLLGEAIIGDGEYKVCCLPKGSGSDETVLGNVWSNSGITEKGRDYGDGTHFTFTQSTDTNLRIYVTVRPNYPVNLTVKPMLTTNLKATYKEFVKRVGGFTNLLSVSTPTQTINGVTFTNNGDGTITVNGTATGDAFFDVIGGIKNIVSSTGQFKLSGCPKGGGATYNLQTKNGGSWGRYDKGDGNIVNSPVTEMGIQIYSGTVCNNLVFKPMLTESLLPEYFDFVKGVEGGITPQMFGCTKMAVNKVTVASRTLMGEASNGFKFAHTLGEVPKHILIVKDSTVGITTNDFVMAESYRASVPIWGVTNANQYDNGAYYNGSALYISPVSAGGYIRVYSYDASTIIVSRNGYGSSYYRYVNTGTYTVIAMA